MARNPHQNGQLRRARKERHLTQAQVAEGLAELAWCRDRKYVAVNADMYAKWERGEKSTKVYEDLLCLFFDATPAELGLAPPDVASGSAVLTATKPSDVPWAAILLALGAPGRLLHGYLMEEWENDLLKRRELLKSMGLAAVASTLATVPPPLARGVRHRTELQPDPETLRGLDELATSYQALYHDTAPQVLMTPIRAHLQSVAELLRRSCPPRERQRLLVNQSQVALLAGRLAFFDLRDPLSARGYLTMAYDSAVAGGDAALIAAALGHLGFVPAASGQWSAATDHLDRAFAYAERGAPSIVRSWLAAVSSEMRTDAGDHRGALVAIDEAKRLERGKSCGAPPPWFDFYDESRLAGFEGYALLHGGSAAAAAHSLEAALAGLAPTAVKQRTVFLTDLANANVAQGDVDEACDLAIRAATDARVGQYATCVARLREFRSSLRPYETSRAVRELDHAMVDL